ncbi:hypothetical protein BH20ACT5_BH20ACT5_08660 [soil metagenome]
MPAEQPALVVFDIDGVVADVTHRLHFLEARPKRWEDFFAAAAVDPPLAEGLNLVAELGGRHDLCWLTGRPERNRALTEAWLAAHDLPTGPLLMRADRDHRPARAAKRDHLRRLRRSRRIAVVIDDDPAVITMLAEEGIAHLLAEWLPHSSTLQQAQERDGRT